MTATATSSRRRMPEATPAPTSVVALGGPGDGTYLYAVEMATNTFPEHLPPSREHAELDRALGRLAAARLDVGSEVGHGGWCSGVLGSSASSVPRDAGATLLGAQDGEPAQQDAQERATPSQGGPARDLDGRDPWAGVPGLRHVPGQIPGEVWGRLRMSPKRSRRTADVLRFPGRALDPLADDQPDRIDLCDDPATSSPDQGQRHTEGKPDDDVQARRSRSEEMAAPARLGTVNACSRRKGFRGRSAAGRRLIHLLGTQHLTIPLSRLGNLLSTVRDQRRPCVPANPRFRGADSASGS